MTLVLGPRAKRVDILAYKGIRWSTDFSLKINGVQIVLGTGTIITGIKRDMSGSVLQTFTQTVLDATHTQLILPAVNSLTTGLSPDDPLSKYVYSVVWRSPSIEFMVYGGELTLAPVAANV